MAPLPTLPTLMAASVELLDRSMSSALKYYSVNSTNEEDRADSVFGPHQLRDLKIVTISSCALSIVSCVVMMYTYFAMHHSRLKFRHKLIFILIIYDLFKAVSVIIYPLIALNSNDPQVISLAGVDALGFFTAMSIEGGDLAILAFAVHTCLTIFNSKRVGGLYPWRYYYYVSTVIIPCTLAGLAFIDGGYVALDVWCYLPQRPQWMRYALSFGPRYFIILTILIIYVTIYIYVQIQLRNMNHQRKSMVGTSKRRWWSLIKLFEKTVLENGNTVVRQGNDETLATQDIINNLDINIQLQQANSDRLKTRYRIISRQMRLIFLYPVAYFFLWILPIVDNSMGMQFIRSFGLSVTWAWLNIFNGTVDTFVFLIREKPWRYTYENITKSGYGEPELVSHWRYKLRHMPLYGLPVDMIKKYESTYMNPESSNNNNKLSNLPIAFEFDGFEETDGLSMVLSIPEKAATGTRVTTRPLTASTISQIDDYTKLDNVVHTSGLISSSDSNDDENTEEEVLNFLDFLRRGPPTGG